MLQEANVFVALGANLIDSDGRAPLETCRAAVTWMEERFAKVTARSSWYESEPVPPSDQPWFVNGVIQLTTDIGPGETLAILHELERRAGRVRRIRWEARILDLDLIAYGACVSNIPGAPELPHPRLGERAFVLEPLDEIAPDWRHPVSGLGAAEMLAALPPGQRLLRLP